MTPEALQPFENAAYPCFWLDKTTGTLWLNDCARQADMFGGSDHVLQKILSEFAPAHAPQPQQPYILPLADGARAWAVTVMPLAGGVLATATEQSAPPISSLGSSLREPITSIFATLPLLSKRLDAPEVRYVEEIQTNCYSLLRLATNLETIYLPATRYSKKHPFDFAALVKSVGESAASVCHGLGVPFHIEVPPKVLPVLGNSKLVSEAILNVIRNSLQFGRDGNQVTLRLRRAGGQAVLSVEDHGIGIKPEHVGHIFEAYYSADPYGDGAPPPSLGAGLCVAQQVMRGLGGSIHAESTFGVGTRVFMSLPIAADTPPDTLGSEPADYLLNRYSTVYVQLIGYCRLPSL